MNSAVYALRQVRPVSAATTVVSAGAIAAALDLLFAFTFYGMRGTNPVRILQVIGSGWFGKASFSMGWTSAAAGFVSHFAILIFAAWLFFLAARHLPLLTRNAWLSGMAFGTVVYVVMNYVVVPLSAVPQSGGGRSIDSVLGELASHLFFVGVPIALLVRRYYRSAG